jgi:hypothetical protein
MNSLWARLPRPGFPSPRHNLPPPRTRDAPGTPRSPPPTATGSFRLAGADPARLGAYRQFPRLTRVETFARDLLEDAAAVSIEVARVEFWDRRGWHTAWSWAGGRS